MKNLLLALIIIVLSIPLQSQITIVQSDLPSVNDTIRYSVSAPLPGIDFSTTGENFTWDFSQIGFQTQGLEQYVSVASVNFLMGFLFGAGAIAQQMTDLLPGDDFDIEFDNLYAVYRNNNTGFARLGFFLLIEGLPLPLRYAADDFVYRYPLNFGNIDSTAFGGSISLGDTLSLHSEGYRINEVDGWGTVSTPYGTFETLRIRTTLFEYDSLYWESLPAPVVLPRTTIQYKWLANNEKFPVMEASYFLAPDESLISIGIRYRDIYREPEDDPDPVDTPVADFSANKTEGLPGDTILFFNNSTPVHSENIYIWDFDPSSVNFLNSTNNNSAEPQVSFSEQGSYSVSLTATNISGQDVLTRSNYIIIHDHETSISPYHHHDEVSVSYRQKEHILMVLFAEEFTGTLLVYDVSGRKVLGKTIPRQSEVNMDISHLPPAPYVLILAPKSSELPVITRRFIRQ